MNIWDWIELFWLGGLSLLALCMMAVQNRFGLSDDHTFGRVSDLEDENERLKTLLLKWTDALSNWEGK